MMKKVMTGVLAITILITTSEITMASEVNTDMSAEETFQTEELAQVAVEREENIVLIDEQERVLGEFHTDGYTAEFTYMEAASESGSSELVSISDSDGKIQNFSYDENGDIDKVDVYLDGVYLGTREYFDNTVDDEDIDANIMPLSTYTTFYVHHEDGTKTNMSNIITDTVFKRQSTSATQADIQNLFTKNGSPLKNNIAVYQKNSNGNVYNTGRTITPAKVVYDASVKYNVSPKVILVTLQKENSMVSSSHASDGLSNSCFYFCMCAGSSSSSSTTGFDNQIDLGTKTLRKWFDDVSTFPYYYSNSGFRGYKGYGYSGYDTAIWCDNAATYSLYKYTNYTCVNNEKTWSANTLFWQLYYSYKSTVFSGFPF